MVKMKNEKDVKKAVRKMVRENYPNAWEFMPVQTGFGKTGVPDILYCIDGKFVAIETKFGYNQCTPRQSREIELIKRSGGVAIVVNDSNYEQVLKCLFVELDYLKEKND